MDVREDSVYEFGSFRLDPVKRVLWRGAERVALTSRAFDTLHILVQNYGRTVDKEEIIQKVWAGAVVEENNLTQCISLLRKALGEVRGDHRFIVTVPGRGYRFVADVQRIAVQALPNTRSDNKSASASANRKNEAVLPVQSSAEIPAAASNILRPGPAPVTGAGTPTEPELSPSIFQNVQSSLRNRIAIGLVSLLVVAAILAFYFGVIRGTGIRSRLRAVRISGGSRPAVRRTMLAVLPFENLTGDPGEEYFSDGFTEEVITRLGRLDPRYLGVIARTSVMQYKHSAKSIRQVAGELGVGYVLEGSVRRWGNRVRVSVQLIKAGDQTHVWAQSFEGSLSAILSLQERVAQNVREQIGTRLLWQSAAPHTLLRTVDPEAYERYLEGLYFLNRRDIGDFKKAIAEFEKAVERDAGYAPAYAGLANGYCLLSLYGGSRRDLATAAEAAAARAVALSPSLAETHTALAAVRVLYFWDWAGAEHEFKRALDANSNYALAHHWYAALYLAPQGHYAAAIKELELARQLDPVSPIVNTDLGWAYAISGDYDQALARYQEALHLDPRFVPVHFRLSEYYLMRGMYAQATHESALDLAYAGSPQLAFDLEQAYKKKGFLGVIQSEVEAARRSGGGSSALLALAQNYALLGKNEAAIDALSTLYQRHDPSLVYLRVDPALSALRSDRRFQDLERRCGLTP